MFLKLKRAAQPSSPKLNRRQRAAWGVVICLSPVAATARIRPLNTAAAFRCSLLTFLLQLTVYDLLITYWWLLCCCCCAFISVQLRADVGPSVRPYARSSVRQYVCPSVRSTQQLRFQFLVKVFSVLLEAVTHVFVCLYACCCIMLQCVKHTKLCTYKNLKFFFFVFFFVFWTSTVFLHWLIRTFISFPISSFSNNKKMQVTNKIYCLWFCICCFMSHFFCSPLIYDELTCLSFFIKSLLSPFSWVWVIVVRPKGVGVVAFILIFILLLYFNIAFMIILLAVNQLFDYCC